MNITPEALGERFAQLMTENLTTAQLMEVRRLNAREPLDGSVCHTHDFLDANEIMADALALEGVDMWTPDGHMADGVEELWSEAWRHAFVRHLRG